MPEQPPPPTALKRQIPKDYPFASRSLKPLARTLWAASVGLGHALSAYRHFSRIKSSTVSPDGLIGGRGYVSSVQDIRRMLNQACENLSAATDVLHDEINALHWKTELKELPTDDQKDIELFVEESEDLRKRPERSEKVLQDTENSNNKSRSKESSYRYDWTASCGDPLSEDDQVWSSLDFATSTVPDDAWDETPTDAWDFGMGYGARGQGIDYGYWGPVSQQPGQDVPPTHESSPMSDSRHSFGLLPNDSESPVARADYYRGDGGNLVNTQSQLPDHEPSLSVIDRDLMNTSYSEQDVTTPYVRFSPTTVEYRPDPLYDWPQET